MAAFAFLGAVNWIYKWFRSEGQVNEEQLVSAMQEKKCRDALLAAGDWAGVESALEEALRG